MPSKGSKALNKKYKFIGKLASNKKVITSMEAKLEEQNREINRLEHCLKRKKDRIDFLQAEIEALGGDKFPKTISINPVLAKRRRKNPSTGELNNKSTQRRRKETIFLCSAIHGGTVNNKLTVINGLFDSLACILKSDEFAVKALNLKASITSSIKKKCADKYKTDYFRSQENLLCSVNVYYSHNVIGKQKYMNITRASKAPGFPDLALYKNVAKKIRSVDIGTLFSINPKFTQDLDGEECGDGIYRCLITFLPRLAQFYLNVNNLRVDKLKFDFNYTLKNENSCIFLIAIGGDEAPHSGTSFLVSFLNIGKRVVSSSENFLLFGANVKENGVAVRRYISFMLSQLKTLENEVYTVTVPGKEYFIEFKVELLPNDMKMLAFLKGELTNAAYFFTTFANVNKDDTNDISKKFSLKGDFAWKPFTYEKRIADAAKVASKKAELHKKNMKECMFRQNLTSFIGKSLKSRQEEIPLVGEYIDKAYCESLHLKNNVVKEMFLKVINITLSETILPKTLKSFYDLSEGNLFFNFIQSVKNGMNCNFLTKKIIAWFNENQNAKKQKDFAFRFRGKKSYKYLQNFPLLILNVIRRVNKTKEVTLMEVFYESIYLRKLVSISVRIDDINNNELSEMFMSRRRLFVCCSLYDVSVSPSLWCFSIVAPHHAKHLFHKFGFGLGINTMEGREQKHQQITKYSKNTTYQNRWADIFRHEYMQLICLRENGFDLKKYQQSKTTYMRKHKIGLCECSLPLIDLHCEVCDSDYMVTLRGKVDSYIS